MNRAIFQAGLNWRMIEKKWPNFQRAFSGFSIEKTARLGEKDVTALMRDQGIVRNEKKIRATILNAQTLMDLKKEYGSFRKYLESFGGDEVKLIADLQHRFRFLGPSSARVFLMMSGTKLKPTKEEMDWRAKSPK